MRSGQFEDTSHHKDVILYVPSSDCNTDDSPLMKLLNDLKLHTLRPFTEVKHRGTSKRCRIQQIRMIWSEGSSRLNVQSLSKTNEVESRKKNTRGKNKEAVFMSSELGKLKELIHARNTRNASRTERPVQKKIAEVKSTQRDAVITTVDHGACTVYGANRCTGRKEDKGEIFVGMGLHKMIKHIKPKDKSLLLERFHRIDLLKSILRVGIRELIRELKKMRDEKETHLINELVSSFHDKTSLDLTVKMLNYVADPCIRSKAAIRLCLGHGNNKHVKNLLCDVHKDEAKTSNELNRIEVLRHLHSKCSLEFDEEKIENVFVDSHIKESDFEDFFGRIGVKKTKSKKKHNMEITRTDYENIKNSIVSTSSEENERMRRCFVQPALTGASRNVSVCAKDGNEIDIKKMVKCLKECITVKAYVRLFL